MDGCDCCLWWADPLAALIIVIYALREAREISRPNTDSMTKPPSS
jgi:divalent metal cation (Fe/Co/Zn/Cd) transporter